MKKLAIILTISLSFTVSTVFADDRTAISDTEPTSQSGPLTAKDINIPEAAMPKASNQIQPQAN